MLIQNQLVEVKITPSNVKHFRNFGYQVKMMDIIFVPIEHLMDNSHSKIWVQCDVCGENYQKEYRTYVNGHSYNMDTCTNCSYIKSQKTCMERYGVPYAILSTSIQISSQQRKIYELIKQKYSNAELNYPFSNCLLDVFVCINNINIDIEYDGGYWHQDQQQDIRRDKFLQAQGFKVLRIRSGHKIPSEEELFFAINELVTTNRIFKEIVLSDWKEQHKINEEQEVSV